MAFFEDETFEFSFILWTNQRIKSWIWMSTRIQSISTLRFLQFSSKSKNSFSTFPPIKTLSPSILFHWLPLKFNFKPSFALFQSSSSSTQKNEFSQHNQILMNFTPRLNNSSCLKAYKFEISLQEEWKQKLCIRIRSELNCTLMLWKKFPVSIFFYNFIVLQINRVH